MHVTTKSAEFHICSPSDSSEYVTRSRLSRQQRDGEPVMARSGNEVVERKTCSTSGNSTSVAERIYLPSANAEPRAHNNLAVGERLLIIDNSTDLLKLSKIWYVVRRASVDV